MKGFIALVVGLGMTMSPAVTTAVADQNGEVHTWTSGSRHVSSDGTGCMTGRSEGMSSVSMSEMPMASGARVYFVDDDPAYDLSGARDHWFLVGDGTSFHQDSWHSSAVLASGGMARHEVVAIPAEYRQDWLAVSAGDRPVRSFAAPRSEMNTGSMASSARVTNYTQETTRPRYASARNADTFRPVHQPMRHRRVHYTAAQRTRTYHHRHHAAMTVSRRSTSATYSSAEPAVTPNAAVTTESTTEIRRDPMGHELLQMGSSWYMRDNGDWYRAESWRGPFARVKKGMVPREVRMSQKHPSRMDLD
jgi:hypothetical protein